MIKKEKTTKIFLYSILIGKESKTIKIKINHLIVDLILKKRIFNYKKCILKWIIILLLIINNNYNNKQCFGRMLKKH